jgi:PAS domain-containing protein
LDTTFPSLRELNFPLRSLTRADMVTGIPLGREFLLHNPALRCKSKGVNRKGQMQFTIKLNDHGLIDQVSPEAEDVLGFRPDEIVGKLYLWLVIADDRNGVDDAFKECLQDPKTPIRFSVRLRSYGGGRVPSDTTLVNNLTAASPTIDWTISALSRSEKLHSLTPEQQRHQESIARDFARYGIDQKDAQALSLPVAELGTHYPQLSKEDVERIAEAVSYRITQDWGESLKAKEKEAFRSKVARIAEEIAIGIASSALYELLTYLFHAGAFHFASASVDSERTERLSRLTKGVSPEVRGQLMDTLPALMVVQARFFREKENALTNDAEMASFIEKLRPHYSGPFDEDIHHSLVKSVYAEVVRSAESGIQ